MYKKDTRLQTSKEVADERSLALKVAKAISKLVVEHRMSYVTPTTLLISSSNLQLLKKVFPYSFSEGNYKEGNLFLKVVTLEDPNKNTVAVGYNYFIENALEV